MKRLNKKNKLIILTATGTIIVLILIGTVIWLTTKTNPTLEQNKKEVPLSTDKIYSTTQTVPSTVTTTTIESPNANTQVTVFEDNNNNNNNDNNIDDSTQSDDDKFGKTIAEDEEALKEIGGHEAIEKKTYEFCNAYFNCDQHNLGNGIWRQNVEACLDSQLNTTGKFKNNRLQETVYTVDWDVNCGTYSLFFRELQNTTVVNTYCTKQWSENKDESLPVATVRVAFKGTYEPKTQPEWDLPRDFENEYKIIFDKNLKVKALMLVKNIQNKIAKEAQQAVL